MSLVLLQSGKTLLQVLTNESTEPIVVILLSLGIIVATSLVVKLVSSTYKTFFRPSIDLKRLGKWAVITGATDGIGKAYAYALAKKGCSVCLISRTESKLKDVCTDISNKKYPGVEVKYIVCDYTKFNEKNIRDTVAKELDTLEIGVLINNVGMSYRYPRYFHELPDEEVQDLLTMNIDTTVWMTRIVLPGMLQRKKGAIVNVSSASALYTLPLLAVYGGTKSFVEKFSRACNAEYGTNKSSGVSFQAQVPFYVATKLAKMRKSISVPTPEEYVNVAMKWIGYTDSPVSSPFWIHAVQGWLMFYVPDMILASVIKSMHLAIRKKGLKKDEATVSLSSQDEGTNGKKKE